MYVEDIMTEDVITVKSMDTIETCAKLLNKHIFSGLPVVDEEGYLTGMITEGDLIRHNSTVQVPAFLEILGGIIYLNDPNKFMENVKKSMSHLVGDVMTKDVATVRPNANIEDVAQMLVERKIKRVPVVDKAGKLIGIVARKDIMNYLFSGDAE